MTLSWGRWQQREGWRAFAVDGSRVECPRTKANKEVLGCAGRDKTGPQLFVTTLWHMGMGIHRSLKQTMQRRKMLSRTPQAAECELIWTMFGMWLLGLMGVAKILARGADHFELVCGLSTQPGKAEHAKGFAKWLSRSRVGT